MARRENRWLPSAVDCQVALMLARPEGAPDGSSSLSLFYMEVHREDGSWNDLRLHRLKDKLGTRALPTGELTLEGAVAHPVGELGRGVKKITTVLNLTRLHNAINACGMMARQLQLLRDYSRRRVAFGGTLAERPLHRETLADLHVEYEAALALTLDCARLLGRAENGEAGDEEKAALRLLTPLAKLFTGKQAVAAASEAVEGFGGAGYVEDSGIPVWLRDAQVLSIWEGTTNVLALDALRAATHDGALAPTLGLLRRRLEPLSSGPVAGLVTQVCDRLGEYGTAVERTKASGDAFTEAAGRRLALGLAGLAAATAMLEQAAWAASRGHGPRTAMAAERFLAKRLVRPLDPDQAQARLGSSGVLSGLSRGRTSSSGGGAGEGPTAPGGHGLIGGRARGRCNIWSPNEGGSCGSLTPCACRRRTSAIVRSWRRRSRASSSAARSPRCFSSSPSCSSCNG